MVTHKSIFFIDALNTAKAEVSAIPGVLETGGLTDFSVEISRNAVGREIELGCAKRCCGFAILRGYLSTNASLTDLCVCFTAWNLCRGEVSEEGVNL